MKNKIYFSTLLVIAFSLLTYIGWRVTGGSEEGDFECQAKLHVDMGADTCKGSSVFELFLSMHDNGKGYLLVTGSYSCPNSQKQFVDRAVDFTYKKEGSYYTLHFGARDHELTNISSIFKYDNIRIKMTKLDPMEYLFDVPLRSPFVCKKE
ncbi:MAG: hypothetical protein E7K92_13760 [Serratia marcescens]|nr:hypothetical protein [Serratia marcescens]